MNVSLQRAAENAGTTFALGRFSDRLESLSPFQTARINPYEFAAQAGISPQVAVDTFVHGAKLGVFDLEWGSICSLCGAIMHATHALNRVAEDSTHCAYCRRDIESVLDDTVEVTFSLASANLLDVHSDFASYQALHTSSAYPYRDEWRRYHEKNTVADIKLKSGESGQLAVDLEPGEAYRLLCMDTHSSSILRPGTGETDTFVLENGNLLPDEADVPSGRTTLNLENRMEHAVWFRVMQIVMDDVRTIMDLGPPKFSDRLTGKQLLNNQAFRDCFSMRELAPDLKLKLRSLTLLFTDLKGSTALYDREGDLAAYRLVQDHFTALKSVVRVNSGAMIKTMGDAIMAAFPDSPSGTSAAIQMMGKMNEIASDRTDDVGLKVGLHSGPALAINAGGSVDYFGQTVNIAARVQGQADAGDICVTPALNEAENIPRMLEDAGYYPRVEKAELKGVSSEGLIIRYRQG